MKELSHRILLFALLIPCYAIAQKVEPSKGDAVISVKSEMSLLTVAKLLMAHNYTIDKIDTTLNFITTLPRSIPTVNGEYFLNIVKEGDIYIIKGMMRFNFTASLGGISSAKGAYDIAKYTKSQSPSKRVFTAAWQAANGIGEPIAIVKW